MNFFSLIFLTAISFEAFLSPRQEWLNNYYEPKRRCSPGLLYGAGGKAKIKAEILYIALFSDIRHADE